MVGWHRGISHKKNYCQTQKDFKNANIGKCPHPLMSYY